MKYDIDGHLWWAPTRKLGKGWVLHKDTPSAPTPPDPYQTAAAQTQSNQQTANYNAQLNRVNMKTPWGNLTYNHAPAAGQTFDQAGYDAAMAKYNAAQNGGTNAGGATGAWAPATGVGGGQDGMSGGASGGANQTALVAPNKADFMSGGSDGSPDQWTGTVDLSPDQQKLLDLQNQTGIQMGQVASNQLNSVANTLSAPVNFNGAPGQVTHVHGGPIQTQVDMSGVPKLIGGDKLAQDLGTQRDSLYNQQTAYLDPQWQNQQNDLKNQLTQQGVMQNSDAWNRAMDDMNRQRSFAYNQAANSAITGGGAEQSRLFGVGLAANQNAYGQALNNGQFANSAQSQTFGQALQNAQLQNQGRQQNISEILAQRNQPLNELNALRSGSQVTAPQFPNAPGAEAAGTNIAGLVGQNYANQMGAYNSQVAQNNQFTNGLFSLGGAAMLAPVGTFSDRRLKTNVTRIGTHPLGIGIYSFDYVWGEPSVGVMADEVERVLPAAVSTHSSGFQMVNYGML